MTLENLKYIIGYMMEELEGAKEYASWALKVRQMDKGFADSYKAMAATELNHADTLAAQAQQIVNANKNDEAMSIIWEWGKEIYIKKKREVRMTLEMYA